MRSLTSVSSSSIPSSLSFQFALKSLARIPSGTIPSTNASSSSREVPAVTSPSPSSFACPEAALAGPDDLELTVADFVVLLADTTLATAFFAGGGGSDDSDFAGGAATDGAAAFFNVKVLGADGAATGAELESASLDRGTPDDGAASDIDSTFLRFFSSMPSKKTFICAMPEVESSEERTAHAPSRISGALSSVVLTTRSTRGLKFFGITGDSLESIARLRNFRTSTFAFAPPFGPRAVINSSEKSSIDKHLP
mmetsp:Transcript_49815/g.103937  ORF Transcript_49815/g.103937 Transcript_49815/m.103937 type:complete len:253 (-) Transcript_49815:211-969(-)